MGVSNEESAERAKFGGEMKATAAVGNGLEME